MSDDVCYLRHSVLIRTECRLVLAVGRTRPELASINANEVILQLRAIAADAIRPIEDMPDDANTRLQLLLAVDMGISKRWPFACGHRPRVIEIWHGQELMMELRS